MRICIYGASSDRIDEKYKKAVYHLCDKLAKRGHTLIFGAGSEGLMGAAARAFKANGQNITGVVPEFFRRINIEPLYDECDNLIYAESMSVRKSVIEQNADAFIAVPGGIGTYDEFFQTITQKQLTVIDKPIVLFNVNGFYNGIQMFMEHAFAEKFLRKNALELYRCYSEHEEDEIIEYIEAPADDDLIKEVETQYGDD